MEAAQDASAAAAPAALATPSDRLPRWLALLLLGLVFLRVGYHSAYLVEVPFGLATFSDGRLYEEAALDILAAPPWGTEPFYLQGLYAYQLALPMAIRPWVSLGLLLQLLLAALSLVVLYRALVPVLGRRDAGLSLVVVLLCPELAFYENKFLTASLAVVTMIGMLAALGWLQRRPSRRAAVALGIATGLAVLARGNMLLALPGVAIAAMIAWRPTGTPGRRALPWLAVGLVVSMGPMALRNQIVTGQPSVFPVHGGGTSFYIGNNQHARGVWNTAGGLLSGEVTRERQELVVTLGIEPGTTAEQSAAIGRALYRRAVDEIAADPGRWLWLELRKAWLMIGNDELSQDYDVEGERELLPWWSGRGLPFSVLLALGLLGAVALTRRARRDPALAERLRPWAWMLAAQALAVVLANLLFFTSAQHRLPLVVPLAVLVGPGLVYLVQGLREAASARDRRAWILAVAAAALLCVQGLWPRQRTEGPSAVHYYNLALAWERLGQPDLAIAAFDRAVERRPDHPVMLLERASLLRRRGRLAGAWSDLERLEALPELPPWIRQRAADERRRVIAMGGGPAPPAPSIAPPPALPAAPD